MAHSFGPRRLNGTFWFNDLVDHQLRTDATRVQIIAWNLAPTGVQ
jgi:hypothetical protein